VDRTIGVLWFIIGATLAAVFFLSALNDLAKNMKFGVTVDVLCALLVAVFSGCNAFMAVLLFQGRSWARIYIGVLGIVVVSFFLLTLGIPSPPGLRWGGTVLGFITAVALLWPRREAVAQAN